MIEFFLKKNFPFFFSRDVEYLAGDTWKLSNRELRLVKYGIRGFLMPRSTEAYRRFLAPRCPDIFGISQ